MYFNKIAHFLQVWEVWANNNEYNLHFKYFSTFVNWSSVSSSWGWKKEKRYGHESKGMALEMGSVPVESLGGSNMQKGPRGLGQMLGPKVKNSETLEFYFLISGNYMFPSYFGIEKQQLFSIPMDEYVHMMMSTKEKEALYLETWLKHSSSFSFFSHDHCISRCSER